jgi:PhzF family phenazine biosynthesis protein
VDAFTGTLFGGNPAAICPLDFWLPDETMQRIAAENNLAETAFLVEDDGLKIRWFTPVVEVALCGHATLAAGHVLFNHLGYSGNEIRLDSRSGILKVLKEGRMLTLDFPADKISKIEISKMFTEVFGNGIIEVWRGKTDYMVVFNTQEEIEGLKPDFPLINTIKARGIIVTAPGNTTDFVSRFFAPQSGIDEDPVTGSAHTTLSIYWASRLKKSDLTAMQLSARKGNLRCRLSGDRALISGECVTFMAGEIHLPDAI